MSEGRFHQVIRMIAVLGARIMELHRDRLGEWDLAPGGDAPVPAA